MGFCTFTNLGLPGAFGHDITSSKIKAGYTVKKFFNTETRRTQRKNKGGHGENLLQTLSFFYSVLSVSPWLRFFSGNQGWIPNNGHKKAGKARRPPPGCAGNARPREVPKTRVMRRLEIIHLIPDKGQNHGITNSTITISGGQRKRKGVDSPMPQDTIMRPWPGRSSK